MITVDAALDILFSLVTTGAAETVPLTRASGRILAEDAIARRDQPPFRASAMDGYAVTRDDARTGAKLTVIGEAAAGHRFDGRIVSGHAVRIFTGAPLPKGADRVVIQEDVTRDGDQITLGETLDKGMHIRPAGADFVTGTRLAAPRRLTPADIALLASMNIAEVPVVRKPVIALIATGDELVMPGETPDPDQIIASNSFGLKALLEAAGAEARLLPIARDTMPALQTAFDLADGADLIVTIGGASVGDHDLVAKAAQDRGLKRAFYKIAMRPGKPLMAGRMGKSAMVGLPGNPVSAMICGQVFLVPMIRAMLGLGCAPTPRESAPLANDIPANGPREHYMRARLEDGKISVADRQDSSLLTVLSQANALMIRPINDGPRMAGDIVEYIPL